MEINLELVNIGNRVIVPTAEGAPGSDHNVKGITLQVQTSRGATGAHLGYAIFGGKQIPVGIRD